MFLDCRKLSSGKLITSMQHHQMLLYPILPVVGASMPLWKGVLTSI